MTADASEFSAFSILKSTFLLRHACLMLSYWTLKEHENVCNRKAKTDLTDKSARTSTSMATTKLYNFIAFGLDILNQTFLHVLWMAGRNVSRIRFETHTHTYSRRSIGTQFQSRMKNSDLSFRKSNLESKWACTRVCVCECAVWVWIFTWNVVYSR